MSHPISETAELLLLVIVADSLDQRSLHSPVLSHAETLCRPYTAIADAAVELLDRELIRPAPRQSRVEILPAALDWIHEVHEETLPSLLGMPDVRYMAENLLLIRLGS